MNDKRYRVVQWATGHSGIRSLEALIEHPQLDLVGVYVYSDAKQGRDAGDLCGLAPTGVIATSDVEDILAATPDCVVYMPVRPEIGVMCRLLESGVNIVTILVEFGHPESLEPEVRRRLEEACKRGNTSLYATGPSPDFIQVAFPIAMTSLTRRLDRLTIEEFSPMSMRNSPKMIYSMFGGDVAKFDSGFMANAAVRGFGHAIRQLAAGLSITLDEVRGGGAVAATTKTVTLPVGPIEAGTVAAWRLEIAGIRGGEPVLQFAANWYVSTDLDPAWELRPTGWYVAIDGDTPIDIEMRFRVPEEELPVMMGRYTANRAVNAVPAVCEAESGIQMAITLPQIMANLG